MTHIGMAGSLGYAALIVGLCIMPTRGEEPPAPTTCAIEIPAGTSLFCPPVPTDGRFDGALGQQLAGAVDKINLLQPGTTNTVQLHLDQNHAWVDESNAPYVRPLEPGQGFVITRQAEAPVTLVFTGKVDAAQEQTITIRDGMSIIGFPGGHAVALATAFESPITGRPVASFNEMKADRIAFLNADGSWRRLLRLKDQIWYDAKTLTNTTLILQPGQALYYQRQPGHGPLTVRVQPSSP